MRTIHTIAAALIGISIATTAHATNTEACKMIGDLARSIMKNRQLDVPMSSVMAVNDQYEKAGGAKATVAKAARALTILAYKQNDYSTDEVREAAIAEFGNQAELACYSGE